MLPDHYCLADKKTIERRVAQLPIELRIYACQKYGEIYLEAYNAEPVEHKKENAARRAANIRLLRYVKAVTER